MGRLRGLGGRAAAVAALLALAGCAEGPKLPHLHLPQVFAPPDCSDFSISIYFEPASAAITPEAEVVLRSAAGRARRCKVAGVQVLGLADAQGGAQANVEISRARAQSVTEALARHGLTGIPIDTAAAGEAGAEAAPGEVNPLRRRADVAFHLEPKPRRH
ncbi:MAG TPA: OmpA family protein [Caulobacteraceae bacterium]|nr:OmpA family protein [Caulobacteraceae bacterium]